MAELSPVHKYATGALFALALGRAQIQQSSLPPSPDEQQTNASDALLGQPWCCEECGLLHHVFRYLGLEQKSWAGLEFTALSPDAKHHIGAFLRILSEEDTQHTPSPGRLSETDLEKAVDAMTSKLEESSSSKLSNVSAVESSAAAQAVKEPAESVHEGAEVSEGGSSPERVISASVSKQRKVAVLYELLVACIADLPEEKDVKTKERAGYDARHRAALRLLAAWFDVPWTKAAAIEVMVAYMAMAAQKEIKEGDHKEEEKSKWAKWKRGGIIGAAAVTGGALLAITGGLAAPAIAAGLAALAPAVGVVVPVIGASGFAAAAAATGSAAGSIAVAASFGAAGASLTGTKMARRIAGIDEFTFLPIGDNQNQGRLAVGIVVSGIVLDEKTDFIEPWKFPDADLEMYAIRWETEILIAVSTAIQDWLTAAVTKELMKQGAMMTVLSGLVAALAWPAALLSITDFIDSRWSMAVDRSDKAGELLSKCLLKRMQGGRPVTLLGFSLGARVIFSCLEKLAAAGGAGIVERVVLFGAPVAIDKQRWTKAREMVAGRFVNCYSTNDWILGVIYRASILSQGLAGLQAVDVCGIENLDVTGLISGHSSYLTKIPEILTLVDIDNAFPIVF